jgi:hypothetical protein
MKLEIHCTSERRATRSAHKMCPRRPRDNRGCASMSTRIAASRIDNVVALGRWIEGRATRHCFCEAVALSIGLTIWRKSIRRALPG